MSEMVYRAAAAVEAAGYNPSTAAAISRIVIAALRNPTDAMLLVYSNPQEAGMYWQAMIDEALK